MFITLSSFRIVFNVKIKQNNDSAFICSELAGRLLEQFIGVNISKALDYLGLNDIKEILDDLALEDENINQLSNPPPPVPMSQE